MDDLNKYLERHEHLGNWRDLTAQAANDAGGLEMVWSKLHGLKVTESRLDYHGSLTIDRDILRAAGLVPLEFVHIWNKNSGARLSTYVLPGAAGGGLCCLNGAAARTGQVGDELIVTSRRFVRGLAEMTRSKPRVVTFRPGQVNRIAEILTYDLHLDGSGEELAFDILRTPY
ncbi:hypothetical protein FACS189460_3690 [Deltaproteobacteria bacterium]|nr:hypothetical protein FACS189460_3690 [Deltaproteobacteria bacterium]